MYNKYLKYKKKYLDLYALKTQMKGGADGDDGDDGDDKDLRLLIQALPNEMKLQLISKMSDAQKINLVYSSDKLDLGIQYLYDPITYQQAF